MQATNPSSRPVHSRLYNLTSAGSRLAHYLNYVDRQPLVADIHFADIPPERFDDERPQPSGIMKSELDRLYAELEVCQEEMFRPSCPNWRYDELRRTVCEIREEIAGIEGE